MNRGRKLINLGMVSLVAIVLPVRAGSRAASSAAPASGEAAITALGGRLGSAARTNGLSPDVLKARLRADATLHVDRTGRVLAVDTDLGAGAAAEEQHGASAAAPSLAGPASHGRGWRSCRPPRQCAPTC